MKRVFNEVVRKGRAPFLFLLLLLLFCAAQSARAQGGGEGLRPQEAAQEPAEQNANLANELKLTPEQIGRIAAIREQTKDERRRINQRVRQAQRALEEAIYADDASQSLIDERMRELSAAQADSTRLRVRTEMNIRSALRPEQLAALREIRMRAHLRQVRNGRALDGGLRPALGPRGGVRRMEVQRRARP